MKFENSPSKFNWSLLGNIGDGRVNLGLDMPVLVYRLFQFTLRDILEREYGKKTACELFRSAGRLAGIQFAENVLDLTGDFDYFIANLQMKLQELKIGILRVESADFNNMKFTLTVSEDLDCSGLPISGDTVCDYDEGFIAGILEVYTGKTFDAKEIDCWSTGDRTCRFNVRQL